MNDLIQFKYIISSVVFSVIGIVVLLFFFWLIDWITPENLRKEIVEKNNLAVAIVMAAFVIALGLIISSAIHG
jgi:uncharacterized membrane protein YjfL (UPF0719 family)